MPSPLDPTPEERRAALQPGGSFDDLIAAIGATFRAQAERIERLQKIARVFEAHDSWTAATVTELRAALKEAKEKGDY